MTTNLDTACMLPRASGDKLLCLTEIAAPLIFFFFPPSSIASAKVLCVTHGAFQVYLAQLTKDRRTTKESKSVNFKLFYRGVNGKKNGPGGNLKENFDGNVLEVKGEIRIK